MLNLTSLSACSNLVKLDLSRNNLSSFPYLGELRHLKFLHIHENKLDIDGLIGIFTDDFGNRKRSPLCQAVVWVTFWGNKGGFVARHFLANCTSALAVDLYMIIDEERKEVISRFDKAVEPFSPLTNLSALFHTNRKFNKNASE